MDSANVVIRPPIVLAMVIAGGLVGQWLVPWPFLPASLRAGWIGAGIFGLGFALAVSSISSLRRAGTNLDPMKPTTHIVIGGPYKLSRNPIYVGMLLGLVGLAVALDTVWLLAALVPFYLFIRHGVIAREEAYLERKFGDHYLTYKSRVRRWL